MEELRNMEELKSDIYLYMYIARERELERESEKFFNSGWFWVVGIIIDVNLKNYLRI